MGVGFHAKRFGEEAGASKKYLSTGRAIANGRGIESDGVDGLVFVETVDVQGWEAGFKMMSRECERQRGLIAVDANVRLRISIGSQPKQGRRMK
jgi:hypothetical protein